MLAVEGTKVAHPLLVLDNTAKVKLKSNIDKSSEYFQAKDIVKCVIDIYSIRGYGCSYDGLSHIYPQNVTFVWSLEIDHFVCTSLLVGVL